MYEDGNMGGKAECLGEGVNKHKIRRTTVAEQHVQLNEAGLAWHVEAPTGESSDLRWGVSSTKQASGIHSRFYICRYHGVTPSSDVRRHAMG